MTKAEKRVLAAARRWYSWMKDVRFTGSTPEDKLYRSLAADALESQHARIAELERDNKKFRNGFDNLLAEINKAPSLPIEMLSADDQSKWTEIITGILMALGPYETTGRPMTIWESLSENATDAMSDSAREGKG